MARDCNLVTDNRSNLQRNVINAIMRAVRSTGSLNTSHHARSAKDTPSAGPMWPKILRRVDRRAPATDPAERLEENPMMFVDPFRRLVPRQNPICGILTTIVCRGHPRVTFLVTGVSGERSSERRGWGFGEAQG